MNLLRVFSFIVSCCVVHGYSVWSENCTATTSLPDRKTGCCGVSTAYKPRLFSGPATSIDQTPWLALIEYKMRSGATKTLCHGALISSNYVLTSAHCVSGIPLRFADPVNIRLGEHDTKNEGPDCEAVDAGGVDCSDGAVRIPIEKIISHPEYEPENRNHRNDIALIKMKDAAPYTDFIRPICLPSEDVTLITDKIELYKAGWGKTAAEKEISSIKLEVKLPIVPQDECQALYKPLNVSLWKGQLCTGGEGVFDICKGDGGSPLVYEKREINEVVGLVSFGPANCVGKIPTANTNVYEYIFWIKNNIVA